MKDRIWTIVAIVAALFPFVTLGVKLFETENPIISVGFAIIVLIFIGTLWYAGRTKYVPLPEERNDH